MSRPTRAVVFDLDGTLVDSMPLVLRAFAHALQPARGEISAEQILRHLGGPPERTFADMLAPGQVPEAMERLRTFSLEHWRLIRPFDGMHPLLDALRESRRAVGLWTGRERESTEWVLDEHGIRAKLDACICGDDLPTHKPHPGGLQESLQRLGTAADESLFVGDADVDVLAGAAAGVRTLLITHDRTVPDPIRRQAWRTVETPAAAYALLRGELNLAA